MTKTFVLGLLSLSVWAGPPLICNNYDAAPEGSLLKRIAPLSKVAIEADDSKEQGKFAALKLAVLRESAKSGKTVALVEAGYLTAALNQVGQTNLTDGVAMLKQALAAEPQNPEIILLVGLAQVGKDQQAARASYQQAVTLAQSNPALSQTIATFGPKFAN